MNEETFISIGNTKLGNIPNVSLTPRLSCGNSCKCRDGECYARKVYNRRPAVKKRWDDNLTLAITNPIQYFQSIHDQIPSLNSVYFRWHVGGDILNQEYLEGMKVIAADFPSMRFLCFTKQYYLNFTGCPRNLRIILSAWPGYPMPKTKLPVAYMQDNEKSEHRIPAGAKKCAGSCHDCSACWHMKRGDAVVFRKH